MSLESIKNNNEIKPKMFRYLEGSLWLFEKKIGDYTYNIQLRAVPTKPKGCYELSFGTAEMGEFLTSQGRESFNQVIEAITELVSEAVKVDKISEIRFGGSTENRDEKDFKELKSSLMNLYKQSPHDFNGFSYDYEPMLYIEIKNDIATAGFRGRENSEAPLERLDVSDKPLVEFLEDIDNPEAIMKQDPKIFFKLKRYVTMGISPYEEEEELIHDDKKARQRIMLYERTLKQLFPNQEFNFDEETKELVIKF